MSTFEGHKIVTNQINVSELSVILRELRTVIRQGVTGDVVELGCYEGTTSLFLQRELQKTKDRKLFVYDSFAGLPPKINHDLSPAGTQFVAGELRTSKQTLVKHFKHAGLPIPHITKCWFSELDSNLMPESIAFAFLDGDFYDSILDSLRAIWPALSSGAVIVVDDYHTEALPGVKKAIDHWRTTHEFSLSVEASLAIIRPGIR